MDDNITYDQLPVMSPMMASNSNESGNGGQAMMDDGKSAVCWQKSADFSNIYNFTDRYFRCEPMDATVSPIALTSQNTSGTPATPAGNSNGSSSNPGTPTN